MKAFLKLNLCILALVIYSLPSNSYSADLAQADTPITVRHYQVQQRYEYGEKLLRLALSKSGMPYDIVAPRNQNMNEARGEQQVIKGNMDIQWLSTTQEREDQLIPVKIPLYRGILGLRLLLVTNDKKAEMETISSIDDLRKYTGAHGQHWGDLPVYAENQLPVLTNVKYDLLFTMLQRDRVDYFHRGANEIWEEQERYRDTLSIADKVMLYYPHPVYFFVSKNNPQLAELVEQGLQKAIDDGSFKRLFLEKHQNIIDKSNFDQRTLISLKNPVVPKGSPAIDTSWWLPGKFSHLVSSK